MCLCVTPVVPPMTVRCVAPGKFSAGILYPDEEVWRRRYRKFTDNQEAKEGGVLRAKRKFEGFVFDFMPNLRGAMANEFFVLKARMIGASLLPNALGRTDHPLDLFQLICFSHHVLCVHRLLILFFSLFLSPQKYQCARGWLLRRKWTTDRMYSPNLATILE